MEKRGVTIAEKRAEYTPPTLEDDLSNIVASNVHGRKFIRKVSGTVISSSQLPESVPGFSVVSTSDDDTGRA